MLESTDIGNVLEKIFETFTSKIETFSIQGSGWVLHKLLNLQLHVAEYQPLRGSVFSFRLPSEVFDKKAVVNIQNRDMRCFIYCVTAALYSDPDDDNLHRPTKHEPHFGNFNVEGLTWPMQV